MVVRGIQKKEGGGGVSGDQLRVGRVCVCGGGGCLITPREVGARHAEEWSVG